MPSGPDRYKKNFIAMFVITGFCTFLFFISHIVYGDAFSVSKVSHICVIMSAGSVVATYSSWLCSLYITKSVKRLNI